MCATESFIDSMAVRANHRNETSWSPQLLTRCSAFCTSSPLISRQNRSIVVSSTRQRTSLHFQKKQRITSHSNAPDTGTTSSKTATEIPYNVLNWTFKSFNVKYAAAGVSPETIHLPSIVLVHGFGANCLHWRHNLGPLSQKGFRVYAIDLLGFGMGDKPTPGTLDEDGCPVAYRFEYWTEQLRTFVQEVAEPSGRPVFLVANSIGAMVVMQMAIDYPSLVAAQVLISPSLRQLNVRKRSWIQDLTAPLLMKLLSYRPLGAFFLESLARPKELRKVLQKAYAVTEAVDDALLSIIAEPALTPGALDVFLAFIMYDEGPIPEDLLPELRQPSLVMWGEEDQFEPYELGQALRHYSTVERFVPLKAVGHCAHDENPDIVNALIGEFASRHLHRAEMPTG